MPSRPIVISPDLAYSIGLNEAIVLQQVHYWLKETTSGMEHDGARWIYNTSEQWLEQFPFWSESTLKRTFTNLKKLGLLRIEQLNQSQRDMTNFYTINYESDLLDEVKVTSSMKSKRATPSVQNDQMEQVKKKRSISSDRPDVIRSNWHDDPTEITTESTTEITGKPSCPVAAQPDEDVSDSDLVSNRAVMVLEHFNRVTNSTYGRGGRTKTTLGYIRGRLAENYSAEDLMLVVDYMTAKWADDSKMSEFLRPRTLFAPENCVEYFEKANKWHASGRPKCVKGRWVKDDAAFKATHGQVDYSLPDNAGFRT